MSPNTITPILPGASIGILGGGQLGRMTAIAAKQLGYQVVILTPDGPDAPACQVADDAIIAAYDDQRALKRFATQVDVVTIEFENIPAVALTFLESLVPVRPGVRVLETTQHRLQEKLFLQRAGVPIAPFYAIPNRESLETIPAECLPGVLKTAGFGYDGKGQIRVKNRFEVVAGFEQLGGQSCVLEAFIDLAKEVSVVGARNQTGFAHFGIIENQHRNHILDVSLWPAQVSKALEAKAIHLTEQLMSQLDVMGLLCVEFFITKQGDLLVNELAPRPHNSGHLTLDGCLTSQFEQHVRSVCGLPLGSTDYACQAAGMLNLLGERWQTAISHPDWLEVWRSVPEAKLHLYGKVEARPGRKMGHINVTGASVTDVQKTLADISERL